MQRNGDQLLFSPSDLGNFTACEHLTQLELAVALGERTRPSGENAFAQLIQRKGLEHERAFLETLRGAGHTIVEIGLGEPRDFEAAARATVEAMKAGAAYVYQAVFVADGWRGIADFLERVERPSALGSWSYEVLDTKLARRPRPEHALQLCFYSHALGRIQETDPEVAYVVLGTRERITLRLADVSAYYRRLRRRFETAVTDRPQTTPYPCEHCSFCDFASSCEEQWEREDHLVRVAGIRRDQLSRLVARGIVTLTALAQSLPETAIPKMVRPTFEGLREQAALQLQSQRAGKIEYRDREISPGRGFAALPRRSPGDLILDLEGHPFFEPARGLDYLFGVLSLDGAEPRYQAFWAHDRAGERRALEAFVDLVHERLTRHPDLHVSHFGTYEPSAVKQLMGEYATREAEVDDLLRRKIFVDLLTLFRQALRAGVPGYSLKELERLVGFARSAPVRDRRGEPGLPGRCPGHGYFRPQPHPPRRSAPARPGVAGRSSGANGRLHPRAPPGGSPDHSRRSGPLSRAQLLRPPILIPLPHRGRGQGEGRRSPTMATRSGLRLPRSATGSWACLHRSSREGHAMVEGKRDKRRASWSAVPGSS